jgi:hypothetical protein
MGKSSAPKAPKGNKVSKKSKQSFKLAKKQMKANNALQKKQFAFFENAYQDNKEAVDMVSAKELEILDRNSEWAQQDRDRFTSVFQPLEDNLVEEAFKYGTEAFKDQERGRAQANVAQQFEAARQSNIRQLEGYGINPGSTRHAALDRDVRLKQAAASAAEANQSDQRVDNTRRALRQEAIGVGQKYPGWADQSTDTAIQAGNSAIAGRLALTESAAKSMGSATDYGQMANTSLAINAQTAGQVGQLQNQAYANQLAAYNAEEEANLSWGEVGMAALGAGAKIASSYAGAPAAAAARGGAIPGPMPAGNPGSQVPMSASPSGGQQVDDVNARLTPGEFVLPVDVVKWKGEEFFQKLIDQARAKKDGASAKPEMAQALPGPATYDSGSA